MDGSISTGNLPFLHAIWGIPRIKVAVVAPASQYDTLLRVRQPDKPDS